MRFMSNMAIHVRFVFVGLSIVCGFLACAAFKPHRRFEYKLSFKGPHLVQRDGTVPFWEHGGHAIASDESIRITPSLRSKRGYVWSKLKNNHQHWEVEVIFRVNGRGRIGADGLAVWFTEEKGTDGPVFGNNDKWKGLGVFFDSFDNDGQHNNPYILAVVNDGTKEFDHHSDGINQQLGGCLRDFRNKPYPVRARIEYYQKVLTVFINSGMTSNRDDYEMCLRSENVELPKEGYFGISAATGGLADDHDAHAFLTHSLVPTEGQTTPSSVSEEERKKFEKEFDEYWKKLQEAKDEFKKVHPDKVKPEVDEDKNFESTSERELKQIYEGQSLIHGTVRDLHRKLDEVIGRQERTLSQISMMTQGSRPPVAQQGGAGTQNQQLYVDTIKRHEVDAVLNNQRELVQNVRDMRNLVNDIQQKASQIQSTQSVGGGGGYDAQKHTQELKSHLNNIQNDVQNLVNRPQQGSPLNCPAPANCVTPFYFFLFMIAQVIIMICYNVYKSNQEAAAKKFY